MRYHLSLIDSQMSISNKVIVMKWEYKIETVEFIENLERAMNNLGKDGWEAFQVFQYQSCHKIFFRRRIMQ